MNPTNILFRMISNPFQRLLLFILTFCVFVGAVPHANALTNVSGTITTNVTWGLSGSPYIVTSSVTVSQGVVLTIAPGAVVKFQGTSNELNIDGTMIAQGTESQPIYFTSYKDDSVGGDSNSDGSSTNPARGDWEFVNLSQTSTGNVVDHVVFRYGGSTYYNNPYYANLSVGSSGSVISNIVSEESEYNGVYIYDASPTVSNSIIRNNGYRGFFLKNSEAVITGNNIFANNEYGIYLEDSNTTITDNTIEETRYAISAHGASDGIVISGNTISSSQPTLIRFGIDSLNNSSTWDNIEATYIISSNLTIPEGTSLTIAPGAVVKFQSTSNELNIEGTLIAQGTESQPIYFTSIHDDSVGGDSDGNVIAPSSGDWEFVNLSPTSTGNVVDHVVFRYGGSTYYNNPYYANLSVGSSGSVISNIVSEESEYNGVYIYDASPTVSNSIIRNNGYRGFFLKNSEAVITGNNIFANNEYGIYLEDSNTTITDNTIEETRYAISAHGASDGIVIIGNTISSSQPTLIRFGIDSLNNSSTWDNIEATYIISSNLTIPEGTSLTIAPGAVVKFQSTSNELNIEGTLIAQGTESQPIYFTSIHDDSVGGDSDGNVIAPSSGDWEFVNLSPTSTGNVVDHVVFRYGGSTYYNNPYYANLSVGSSGSVISNIVSEESEGYGVYIYDASPTVSNSVIRNNDYYGFYLSNSDATITDNSIIKNGLYGIYNTTPLIEIDVENNYWGSSSGPLDNSDDRETGGDYNLGSGDSVSNYVDYRPWISYDPNITLSGFVSSNDGSGINNVTITLAGTGNYATSTLNGNYTFNTLPDGTYTITPSLGTYQFDPALRIVTVSSGTPLPPQNFSTCTAGTTLSGYLVDATTGTKLVNTTFTIDGNNVTTDATGYYEVNGLSCGNHLIVVNIDGFLFYDYNVSTFDHSGFNIKLTRPGTVYGPYVDSGFGGDPVNTATGNYILSSKDLLIPGKGLPVQFKRFYNSQNTVNGPLGYGWGHNYHAFVTIDASSNVTVHWGDGKTQTWTPDGIGGFTAQYGVFDTLTDNGDGTYTLTKKDQTSYLFDTSLRLAGIVDKNSNTISLTYTGDNLTQITDTVGRTIDFSYDTSGRITEVTDPIARTLQYTYDTNGDLIEATDHNGNTTTYAYDDLHQILTAVDPKGNTFVTNVYDALKRVVTSQSDAKGGQTLYIYDSENNITTITDPLGQTYYHHHDELKRLIQEEDALGFSNYFTYDEAGNRTVVTDKNGHTTTYAYDANGNVTGKTDAMGLVTSITYDVFDNPLSRTDPHYDITSFTYDANGNLTETTDPLGHFTTTTYTVDGLPETKTDALGNATTFDYDSQGNLVSVTDPLGNSTIYTYDGVGRRLTQTDALGNTTTLTHDANNNLLTETDALGNITTHAYDANDKRISRTDPMGNTTTFEYDVKDLLTTITDTLGNQTRYSYDALDRKITETDPSSNTTSYSYDEVGNLLSSTDPLGNTSTFTYDANGNRLSVTDPLGNTTSYQYDPLNRTLAMIDAVGSKTQYEYDGLGRKVGVTDPKGNTTSFIYDVVGNLVKTTDALGNSTIFAYDANNNQRTFTNPLGQTTSYQYDALNRKISTTDPLSHTSTLSYDATGQLIASTNAKGQTTQFDYDPLKRLIKVTDPAGGIMSYAYDANGNRLSMSDPNGQVTSYTYDALNRRILQTEALGNLTQYDYDAVGNRISMTDPNGVTTSYVYDARNSLTKITYPDSTVSFTFDANGNRLSMVDSLGTTSYTYDTVNRLTSVADPFGQQVGYGYDPASNRTVLTYPGGKVVNYSYDALNRLASLTDWLGTTTTYTYDAAGRLTNTTNPNNSKVTYTYDAAGRRTGLSNNRSDDSVLASYNFTLDEVGNHTQVAEEQPLAPVWAMSSTDHLFDAENRMTSQNSDSLTYDDNGNLIGQESDIFSYDHANRLVSREIQGKLRQYAYNGFGNRYEVVTDGAVKRVAWDVNQSLPVILSETDNTNIATAYYLYGLGLVSKILPDGSIYTYHYDTRGSTVAITDATESIVNSYAYDGYGGVQSAKVKADNPFNFLGRHGVVDDSDGLNYIRARYYKPGIKRFISKDPKPGKDRFTQSWNMYAYAHCNPVILVDVNGEFVQILVGAGVGAILGVGATVVHDVIQGERSGWETYAINATAGAIGGAVASVLPAAGVNSAIQVAAIATASTNATGQVLTATNQFRKGEDIDQFDWLDYSGDIAFSSFTAWGLDELGKPVGRPAIKATTKYFTGKNIEYYWAHDIAATSLDMAWNDTQQFAYDTYVNAISNNQPIIPEIGEVNAPPISLPRSKSL